MLGPNSWLEDELLECWAHYYSRGSSSLLFGGIITARNQFVYCCSYFLCGQTCCLRKEVDFISQQLHIDLWVFLQSLWALWTANHSHIHLRNYSSNLQQLFILSISDLY
jgi:hypothetical protein